MVIVLPVCQSQPLESHQEKASTCLKICGECCALVVQNLREVRMYFLVIELKVNDEKVKGLRS